MNWSEVAINHIKGDVILHQTFQETSAELSAKLLAAMPGELIVVIGPLRVGKTTAVHHALKLHYGSIGKNARSLPYVCVTAINSSDAGQFSTRTYARQALCAAQHPFYAGRKSMFIDDKLLSSLSRKTGGELYEQLVQTLLNQRCQVLFSDEMQNILCVKGGAERAAWFLQSLKCAATDANVVLILAGTYDLIDVIHHCDQAAARMHFVHMEPYRATSNNDIVAFEEILEAYSTHIHFERNVTSLRDWDEYLFERTLGCVGILNIWLRGALAEAHKLKSSNLKVVHLEKTEFILDVRELLKRSLSRGEGMGNDAPVLAPTKSIAKQQESPDKKKRKAKPFRTNPRRYANNGRHGVRSDVPTF